MPRRPRKPLVAEYRFRIEAYSPETIPMVRLAEYMVNFAMLLGESASVHFDRLEGGSTVLVTRIAREAVPKVEARAGAVERADAPRDAMRAYQAINRMLQDDNGAGRLTRGKSRNAVVLAFPGIGGAEERVVAVRQLGSIEGYVARVGGRGDTIPVLLEVDGEELAGCWADRATAKQLAQKLFEPVRLYGVGRWSRERGGVWKLADFRINSFEILDDAPLQTALERIRRHAPAAEQGTYSELRLIRHGPDPRRRHGGD